MEIKQKVFVGVSGGVDSSVALALLQKATPNNFEELFGRPTPEGFRGFDITGVFLKVWAPDFLPCEWRDERRSAMRVCATLGVPFLTLDCEKEYKEMVVDYMLSEYKAGRTPNPDVFCNKYVKFGVFLKKALEAGATHVATGHYARIEDRSKTLEFKTDSTLTSKFELLESIDSDKDQSYFLSQLGQHELSHAIFPIGHLKKNEVREIARELNLPTAEKKDSQGLCFIGKVDMKEFLAHYIDSKPGDVLNEKGEVVGHHDGAVFYTIGERHGFTLTEKTTNNSRFFVVSKDIKNNTITVSPKPGLGENICKVNPVPGTGMNIEKVSSVALDKLTPRQRLGVLGVIELKDMHWIAGTPADLSRTYGVRFRYRQEKVPGKIKKIEDVYVIYPETSQTDIASGQIAVVYDGNVCVGSGVIS